MDLDRKKVGYIVGAVALLGFCSSLVRDPKPKQEPKQVAVATPEATATHTQPKPRRADLPNLAKQLGDIVAGPAQYTSSKDVSEQTVTYYLKPFAGFVMPMFIAHRNEPKVWRFGLEYMRCDEIDQLGLEVTELERIEAPIGRGYFNAWYEIDGGPLSGCWVKVHSKSVDEPHICAVMPGTPTFWRARSGDLPKGKTR